MTDGVAITTFDNPYNPFTDFYMWFAFDEASGYHTCSYLARVAQVNDQMTEQEELVETERAIDEIIRYDFRNIYKKVYPDNSVETGKHPA